MKDAHEKHLKHSILNTGQKGVVSMSGKVEKMEEMAKMEEEYAMSLDKDVTGLGNIAVNGLVMSIAYDSKKHAGLYRTMATLLKGGPLAVTDIEAEQFEASLKKHIEVEEKMMKEINTLMEGEEDGRVRFLLSEIYADEERHHVFMKNLLEAVVKQDTISDDDIWNMLWRDVPTHGAPRDPYASS